MPSAQPHALLVLVDKEQWAWRSEVAWGTGGWMSPEAREALDWLTFAKLSGWAVETAVVGAGSIEVGDPAPPTWVVIACDPEELGSHEVDLVVSYVMQGGMALTRAPSRDCAATRLSPAVSAADAFSGSSLGWTREPTAETGPSLQARALPIDAPAQARVELDGRAVAVVTPMGRGSIATLGFHPSEWRDARGGVTKLLRRLLVEGAAGPVAWLDLEGALVLRMDDPGGAQNIYNRSWSYRKLASAEWAALSDDLSRRTGRISLGYVSGWVDDGDESRGELRVAGREVERVPARVYPSWDVAYLDRTGHLPGVLNDYVDEFRGISYLMERGSGDLEVHGYTHIHPDLETWAAAPDRYESMEWFRELGEGPAAFMRRREPGRHVLLEAIEELRRVTGRSPTTLICPGDEWTDDALGVALDAGLMLVSSFYLGIRHDDRFCWTTHVTAPYLDGPDPQAFAGGLPVVGYFHDLEPSTEGIRWVTDLLDRWEACGAKTFMDLRELAAYTTTTVAAVDGEDGLRLEIFEDDRLPPVRGLRVAIETGAPFTASSVECVADGATIDVPVTYGGRGPVRLEVTLP